MADLYDLMLLLDPSASDELRSKIVADVESAIAAEGTLVGKHEWGRRTMAYEVRHQADAEYQLLQFHGPPALLERLQRTLRIADSLIRFRLIKLAPGTPEPPQVRAEARPEPAPPAEPVGDAAA